MKIDRANKRYGTTRLFISTLICLLHPLVIRAECPPVVLLSGHEETVSVVAERLQSFRIETSEVPGCPSTAATVASDGEKYTLRILSGNKTDYVREVDDRETIAVLIDAQLRSAHAQMPSWTERDAPSDNRPREEEKRSAALSPDDVPPEIETTSETLIHLGLFFDVSFGYDPSFWTGVNAVGCVGIGPICLGAQIRYANDTILVGDSDRFDVKRLLLEGALYAHLRIAWNRVTLYPGVSLGGGYYSTRHKPIINGKERDRQLGKDGGFRGELHLGVAVRLTKHLYLEVLNISCSISAPPHKDAYPGNAETDPFKITEPRGHGRVGIGVRYDLFYGSS